nr:unnamed protein product [Spirometra erinaceieuropaei]
MLPSFYDNSGPSQCARRDGLVEIEVAAKNLVDPISKLRTTEPYSEISITVFEMTIQKTQTKAQCRSHQDGGPFKEVECTIPTERVRIFLEQLEDNMAVEAEWYRANAIEIPIPGAVLNVTLDGTYADNSASSLNALRLAKLSIQNITSHIEATRRLLPSPRVNPWKTWALDNTERLLREAFLKHGTVQCN